MKHGKTFRKLGRDSAHRWAMMRTMVTQLIERGFERGASTAALSRDSRDPRTREKTRE